LRLAEELLRRQQQQAGCQRQNLDLCWMMQAEVEVSEQRGRQPEQGVH
jgi:hypothetical protein